MTGSFRLPLHEPLPKSGGNLYASLDGFETVKKPVKEGDPPLVEIELPPKKTIPQIEQRQPEVQMAGPLAPAHRRENANEMGHATSLTIVPVLQPDLGAARVIGGVGAAPPAGPAAATQAPSILPPPVETAPATENVSLAIESARLNEWFQTGPNGNAGFWPKNIRLVVDNQTVDLASNLSGGSPSVPAFSKTVSVRRGSLHYVFRVELDEKVAKKFNLGSTHQSFFSECVGAMQVEHDLKVTPFVTIRGKNIPQCKLLTDSDPMPDRVQ